MSLSTWPEYMQPWYPRRNWSDRFLAILLTPDDILVVAYYPRATGRSIVCGISPVR
jgi:hypothetical protein